MTPAGYLELLAALARLLKERRAGATARKRRLEAGLEKLAATAAQAEAMRRELQELQPALAATRADVEAMVATLAADKSEAAATRERVAAQECEADEQAAAARAMADAAQRELDAALPALDAAVASLKNLSRSDIVEVKSMQNPPAGVRLVIEAACVMFDERPKMRDAAPAAAGAAGASAPAAGGGGAGGKPGGAAARKVADYWDAGKRLLADPTRFLESLLTYNKDAIPDGVIKRVRRQPAGSFFGQQPAACCPAPLSVDCQPQRPAIAPRHPQIAMSPLLPPSPPVPDRAVHRLGRLHARERRQGVARVHLDLHVGARDARVPPRGARGRAQARRARRRARRARRDARGPRGRARAPRRRRGARRGA